MSQDSDHLLQLKFVTFIRVVGSYLYLHILPNFIHLESNGVRIELNFTQEAL